jgi:hypothetical protein
MPEPDTISPAYLEAAAALLGFEDRGGGGMERAAALGFVIYRGPPLGCLPAAVIGPAWAVVLMGCA